MNARQEPESTNIIEEPTGGGKRRSPVPFLVILIAIVFFLLAYFSPVSWTHADPRGGLLVTQNLIEHHTFQLDAYQEEIENILGGYIEGALVNLDGHIYYYFPMGGPIFSIPFVTVAKLLGLDMADVSEEQAAQNTISAVILAAIFIIFYLIARNYLGQWMSLILATLTVAGTTIISTVAGALWSIDFAVLFVSLSLLFISRTHSGRSKNLHPFLLGFCLFAAFLSRPSTAVFVALVLGYLFVVDWRRCLKTAVVALAFLVLFLVISRFEYGQWLPPYYNEVGRFRIERQPIWIALFGNLLSPSRGLFIFNPIFFLLIIGVIWSIPRLKKEPLYWFCLATFGMHLFLISRATRWWGGAAFGPRLLVEIIPVLYLLLILIWREFMATAVRRAQRLAMAAFILLSVIGIFFNGLQGLFNAYTLWWNGALSPNIDRRPAYLLDWDYPQFLANNLSTCEREEVYVVEAISGVGVGLGMRAYVPGATIPFVYGGQPVIHDIEDWAADFTAGQTQLKAENIADPTYADGLGRSEAPDVLFYGWSSPEQNFRWSMCPTAGMILLLDDEVVPQGSYKLIISAGSNRRQPVQLSLNNHEIGEMTFDIPVKPPQSQSLDFPGEWLQPGQLNVLALRFPEAEIFSISDQRRLGIALESVTISEE